MPFIRVPDRFGKSVWFNIAHVRSFREVENTDTTTEPHGCWVELINAVSPFRVSLSAYQLACVIAEAESEETHG